MNILNLSLDSKALDKNSQLAKRILEYAELADKYLVIAPSAKKAELTLSNKVKIFGSGGGNKFISIFKIFCLANKLIKKEKINIVSVQDQYFLGLAGWLIARKNNIALEIQVHGFEKYYGLRRIVARFILPRADAIRTVSERLKKRLIEEFGVDEKKITVVPVFVDTSDTPPLQRGVKGVNFIFLTAGRLVPVKNISLQIEAMAEIVKKYPNCELWIAGDGPESQKLKVLASLTSRNMRDDCQSNQSEKLKVEDKVKFLGWQADLGKYYEQADVFMLTSNAEGWPLVIIEAINHDLPIIMTDVGSAGDLIINNQSGLVIPINDKEKLVEAMLRLITDSALREKLSLGAREQLSHQPGKKEILKLYKDSWEKALARFC